MEYDADDDDDACIVTCCGWSSSRCCYSVSVSERYASLSTSSPRLRCTCCQCLASHFNVSFCSRTNIF